MKTQRKLLCLGSLTAFACLSLSNCAHEPITQTNAANASRKQITSDSRAALNSLYAQNAAAKKLGKRASGVLVFPHILKGGFVFGAEGGNGALFNKSGATTGYYQTAGASWGLQAGVQKFGYALFLMSPSDVKNLDAVGGWDVGTSPSLVVADRGMATELTAKNIDKGTYAFFFDQKGLMGGLGLKGSKITRINPGP